MLKNINTHIVLIGLFTLLTFPTTAWAEVNGPDYWQTQESTVLLYQSPDPTAAPFLRIPAQTNGLENRGCIDVPTAMTPKERKTTQQTAWCQVSYQNHIGWVHKSTLRKTTPAFTPTFDCTRARHEIEQLICQEPELITLDAQMETVFAAALRAVKGLDTGTQSALNRLKAEQRGWIKGRNDCWKSLEQKIACTRHSYQHRIAWLQAKWALTQPQPTNRYACNDNPAHDIYLTHYATDTLPALTIEYGDRREIFIQRHTNEKTDTRYDARFGKYVILTDSEVRLKWDQFKPELECQFVEILRH